MSEANISDLDLSGKIDISKRADGGGYSDVFQGTFLKGGKRIEVAIKVLRIRGPNGTSAAETRLRKHFFREVLLWRTLQHPNIVPLLGYTMLPNDHPTLVSPWYINGNVISYLELCSKPNRHSLAIDVVNGLEYLHSIPVAHGDLKGENVLVDASGHASLCDFGMSHFIDAASRITGFTTTSANIGGTYRFMCPELFDDQPKTTASDIWALACLIVQILTDEIPYPNINRTTILPVAIMRGDPPMSNRNAAIGVSLWGCIKESWAMAPDKRPTATEVGFYLKSPEDCIRVKVVVKGVSVVTLSVPPKTKERIADEVKLAKMEAEMLKVLHTKIMEKEAKLKQSEEDLYSRHRGHKDSFQKQKAELENRKRNIEKAGVWGAEAMKARLLHDARLAVMEAEMELVFLEKVAEKEAKLRNSKKELYSSYEKMKSDLENTKASLEKKREQLLAPENTQKRSTLRPRIWGWGRTSS